MKLRLNDYIVCPECGNNFKLQIDKSYKLDFSPEIIQKLIRHLEIKEPDRMENDRNALMESYSNGVETGSLECEGCKMTYPILDGIPRILSEDLRTSAGKLGRGNAEDNVRTEKFMDVVKPDEVDNEIVEQLQKANQSNYGFQWKTFAHNYEQWEFLYKRNYVHEEDEFFDNKLGLDAGCGMGRYTIVPAEKGAEMIGVDLSNAVEAAYQKSKHMPNAHFIQGDVFKLPFEKGIFDFAQSIGVIHHTPDPEAALISIKKHVAPMKKIFLMVYKSFEDDNKFKHHLLKVSTQIRRVTSRMPAPLLYWLLYLMIPVVLIGFYFPSWVLWQFPKGKKISLMIPYNYEQYSDRRLRDMHMNLFDRFGNPVERRYNRQDMNDWMIRAGFEKFELENTYTWNVVAITTE
jgi:SAM-dependent methyltransferase/uncharacterized protein YbaR (Trm112 family)